MRVLSLASHVLGERRLRHHGHLEDRSDAATEVGQHDVRPLQVVPLRRRRRPLVGGEEIVRQVTPHFVDVNRDVAAVLLLRVGGLKVLDEQRDDGIVRVLLRSVAGAYLVVRRHGSRTGSG